MHDSEITFDVSGTAKCLTCLQHCRSVTQRGAPLSSPLLWEWFGGTNFA